MATKMEKYSEVLKRLTTEDSELKRLSVESIVYLHDEIINSIGGTSGINDEKLLSWCSRSPYAVVEDEKLFPTIFDKAAKYIYEFAGRDIFADCNEGTALTVGLVFLWQNGYELNMAPEKLHQLILNAANHKFKDANEITPFIEDNVRFISEQEKNKTVEEVFQTLFR